MKAKPLDVHWFTVKNKLYTGRVLEVRCPSVSMLTILYEYVIDGERWEGVFHGSMARAAVESFTFIGPWIDVCGKEEWRGAGVLYQTNYAHHGRSSLWGVWSVGDKWDELKAPYRWGFDIPLLKND